ncbi:serine protease grass [Drosophila teissieri]|uniref:serine protease grass n=1 Tax=Drosophila teissieri TaxID=7243 RepID=UPI001CBA3436|nr:serine protease grass [Drosophila teissieri]
MGKVIAAVLILGFLFLGSQEGSASLLDTECGMRGLRHILKMHDGTENDRQANPWMVSLIVNGEVKCSGSLINDRIVLTAAHCVFNDEMHVHFGTTFSFDRRNPGVLQESCRADANCVRVDKKIVPSQFRERQHLQYDIALLRMQHAVQYSDVVRPICLLKNEPAVARFHITSWGKTEEGYPLIPRVLVTDDVKRIDRQLCSRKFQWPVDESQICVRSKTSNACRGDSGGPMSAEILHMGRYRTFQFGIISYGLGSCAGLNVCTNVTHYMDWIVSVLASSSA